MIRTAFCLTLTKLRTARETAFSPFRWLQLLRQRSTLPPQFRSHRRVINSLANRSSAAENSWWTDCAVSPQSKTWFLTEPQRHGEIRKRSRHAGLRFGTHEMFHSGDSSVGLSRFAVTRCLREEPKKNPGTPNFRPLRNSSTPTPAEASVRTSIVGSAMIHPGLAFNLQPAECFWDLPASARIVSDLACGPGLCVGNVELAVYVRHRNCLPLDTTRSASQRTDFGAQFTAWTFPG
jgi:hypothetical protein